MHDGIKQKAKIVEDLKLKQKKKKLFATRFTLKMC